MSAENNYLNNNSDREKIKKAYDDAFSSQEEEGINHTESLIGINEVPLDELNAPIGVNFNIDSENDSNIGEPVRDDDIATDTQVLSALRRASAQELIVEEENDDKGENEAEDEIKNGTVNDFSLGDTQALQRLLGESDESALGVSEDLNQVNSAYYPVNAESDSNHNYVAQPETVAISSANYIRQKENDQEEELEYPVLKSNRGFAFLMTITAALVFAIVVALLTAIIFAPTTKIDDFSQIFTQHLLSPVFLAPVIVYFVSFLLLSMSANCAGWWVYNLFSIFIALVVYIAVVNALMLYPSTSPSGSTSDFATWVPLLISPYALLPALAAREISIWFGGLLSRRGSRIKSINIANINAYEKKVTEDFSL